MKYLLLFSFLFLSCSHLPFESSKTQTTYTQFRSEQSVYPSSDGKVAYIDKGKGEPILLLHGVPTSGWMYRHVIEDLVKDGYRVIAPDMLGFGSSDNPEGYEIYSEKNHARRIIGLMNSLGIQKWHHVCHDAGGLWTFQVAEQAPGRFQSLTVLNSVLLEEGFNPPVRMERGLAVNVAMAGYRNSITNNVMMGALFQQGLEDCHNLNDIDREGYRRPLLEGKTNSLYYFFSNSCNSLPDQRAAMQSVAAHGCPAQVIWGINDDMLLWQPQAEHVMKLLKISQNDVHLLNANHFLKEEKPDEISRLVNSFIKEN